LQALRAALHRFTPPRKSGATDPPSRLPEADRAVTRDQREKMPEADPGSGDESNKQSPTAPLPVDRPRERRQPQRDPRHPLPNRDLDTGHVVQPGGYSLTDSTYADLLHQLTKTPLQAVPPGIIEDIQAYFSNLDAPITTKKNAKHWNQVLADLKTLATMPTSNAPEPYQTYDDDEDDGGSQ
jgi:hypothetical protein